MLVDRGGFVYENFSLVFQIEQRQKSTLIFFIFNNNRNSQKN